MDAAEDGADTGVAFDEGDPRFKIGDAEKNVVEQGGDLGFCEKHVWGGNGPRREGQEKTTREGGQVIHRLL